VRNSGELPIWDDYAELIKSDVADMKNTGGRPGGAITAGRFPGQVRRGFPLGAPGHRGACLAEQGKALHPPGRLGGGVRLMVRFLRDRAAAQQRKK